MALENLEKVSKQELTRRANELFAEMKTCGHEQRPALLLEAQFYLQERDRRHDSWISLRDLLLELIVIALIGWEVHEGNKQYDLLNTMNLNAAATVAAMQKSVEAMGKLQQAQDDSLKTSNASLLANQQIAETLTNQLRILKVEQDARIEQQNRRPTLELTTVTWEMPRRAIRLESGKSPGEAGVRVTRTNGTNEVTLYFALRNVGSSPAINVTVTPRATPEVYVQCVESGTELAATNWSYIPCEQQSAIIPPIYPRPSTHTDASSGYVIPNFDGDYDEGIRVILIVPPDTSSFDVELTVKADQIVPLVYRLQCHTIN
jgi:hypothetical protein